MNCQFLPRKIPCVSKYRVFVFFPLFLGALHARKRTSPARATCDASRASKDHFRVVFKVDSGRAHSAFQASVSWERRVFGPETSSIVEATTASGAMTATMTVPPRSVTAVTAAAGEAEPMDVECCVPPRLCEEDYTREITLAAYHRDAARVASVLRLCGPKSVAEMSLSRAAAVQLLGEDVYLGSHSWSTQEGFPVMYFAGETTFAPPARAPFPARIFHTRRTPRKVILRGKAAVGNDSAVERRFFYPGYTRESGSRAHVRGEFCSLKAAEASSGVVTSTHTRNGRDTRGRQPRHARFRGPACYLQKLPEDIYARTVVLIFFASS